MGYDTVGGRRKCLNLRFEILRYIYKMMSTDQTLPFSDIGTVNRDLGLHPKFFGEDLLGETTMEVW